MAVVAFVSTAVLAVVFFPARPEDFPVWAYAVSLAVYLAGYGFVPVLNQAGHRERAAGLLLGTGILNIAAVNFTVGFGTGTAVFLVAVAVGAVLVTDVGGRVLRWSVVILTVIVFTLLVVIDTPAAPSVAESWVADLLIVVSFAGVVVFVVSVVWYQRRLADTAEEELVEANDQSERLLLNILPTDIADRLKAGEYPIADRKAEVTVLFADVVGSTAIAETLSADDLVITLDRLFSAFDEIVAAHGLEKIKTVGDSYFAVAGLTPTSADDAAAAADAALRMRGELTNHRFPNVGQVRMRFGIHTGPVVAGVIGKRKFSYDLWGDTVNTASRMESTAKTGAIQVSQEVYDRLKYDYDFESLGSIEVKGKGTLSTFDLVKARTAPV